MFIILHKQTNNEDILVNPNQICRIERNGQHSIVVCSDRQELRVIESVEEVLALLPSAPASPAQRFDPVKETKPVDPKSIEKK
jgi:hypothetical protein